MDLDHAKSKPSQGTSLATAWSLECIKAWNADTLCHENPVGQEQGPSSGAPTGFS